MVVPLSLPQTSAQGSCVSMAPSARWLGASSEGDAWFDAETSLRVIGPSGGERTLSRPPGELASLHPLDASTAIAIVAGDLWRIQDDGYEPYHLPDAGMGQPKSLCGDLARHEPVVLASTAGLFEREADVWWQWTSEGGEPVEGVDRIVALAGACTGPDGEVWAVGAGRPFRLGLGPEPELDVLDFAVEALTRDERLGVSALSGGILLRGRDFRQVVFEAGPAELLAQGGGALWVAAGGRMYRKGERSDWSEIDLDLPGGARIDRIHGDATGGVWVRAGGSLCRRSLSPALRVRGLRPFERTASAEVELSVHSRAATGALEVSRDGVVVRNVDARDGRWHLDALDLGDPGWHVVELRAELAGKPAERSIHYAIPVGEQVEWETDIAPLAEARCTGCHSAETASGPPPLVTYEDWKARAEVIAERVTERTMPPAEAEPLSPEEIVWIRRWVEGGMLP